MMEASMLDLTRGLHGFPHRRYDLALLEVEILVVDVDPDDEAFTDTWVGFSDGRIDEPYELSPSEVIALAIS